MSGMSTPSTAQVYSSNSTVEIDVGISSVGSNASPFISSPYFRALCKRGSPTSDAASLNCRILQNEAAIDPVSLRPEVTKRV